MTPVALDYDSADGTLTVNASGKLETKDYERFVPRVESVIEERGKLNLLLVLNDFHGWSAGALWEDLKFDARHFKDIGRLAIVGDKKWQQGMATFCKPFTTAEVRFFQRDDLASARNWLRGDA
jgi:hypothetical protein